MTTVFFTAILAYFIKDEVITPIEYLMILFGFFGVILIIDPFPKHDYMNTTKHS